MSVSLNRLPVAVEIVAGGGSAAQRSSGVVTPISGVGNGSFDLGTAREFRLMANLRSSTDGVLVLVGYSNPAACANAEYILTDKAEMRESVPSGTTIYFRVIDAMTLEPANGGTNDYLALTKYE